MVRYSILMLLVLSISVYSFKDWYKALCLLIPLLAVLQRPDMPRSILGIQGLNPYNIALLFVLLGAMLDKNKQELQIPRIFYVLATIFFVVLLVGVVRMLSDMHGIYALRDFQHLSHPGTASIIIDKFINPIRFVIPGLLFAMGAHNRERVTWSTYAVYAMGLLLALQILIKMAPALLGHDDLGVRARRVLDRDIGFSRVDAAMMMAMVSCAFLPLVACARTRLERLGAIGAFLFSTVAMAATGGRAGFIAWGAGCALFALLRSRKMLIFGPLLVLLLVTQLPGFEDRLLVGFSQGTFQKNQEDLGLVENGKDYYAMTSGRAAIWPYVIKKIGEAPIFGYGREAMQRTGLTLMLSTQVLDLGKNKTDFGHPHNAYLQIVLDNGIVGGVPVILLFAILGFSSLAAFRRRESFELSLASGTALMFLTAFAVADLSAGSFYPVPSAVIQWCVYGTYLGIRYSANRSVASEPDAQQLLPSEPAYAGALWQRLRGPRRLL